MKNKKFSSDAVVRLINKIQDESQRDLADQWNESMKNAAVCYGRQVGFDTRRIYMNAAGKFWKYLKTDMSNLYTATIQAIENCKPEQYSTRKHIKEASISFAKFLISKGVINE